MMKVIQMSNKDTYKSSLRKLQDSIEKIRFCYQANVGGAARTVLKKHNLYDTEGDALREGLNFFEHYLENISHSIKSDLNTKIDGFRE